MIQGIGKCQVVGQGEGKELEKERVGEVGTVIEKEKEKEK